MGKTRKRKKSRPVLVSIALAALESYAGAATVGKLLVRGPLKAPVDRLDKAFTGAVKSTTDGKNDKVMALMSGLGEPNTLWPVSGLAVLWWLLRGKRANSAALSVALIGSGLLNKSIKETVQRPRPLLTFHKQSSSGSSYPSNHLSMAFAVYGALAFLIARSIRKKGRKARMLVWSPVLLVCSLIAWSRVYEGVHHLSDVIAGWIVGAIWVGACGQVVTRLDAEKGGR